MDMYKKKSLKFSHEQFSRDSRHAETLRARESSRFKRLSMIRSINDSDILGDNSMETEPEKLIETPVLEDTSKVVNQHEDIKLHKTPAEKLIETPMLEDTAKVVNKHEDSKLQKTTAQKNLKKPVSRLEMLKKWKEEKLAKQELEKKLKKKPFTVGVAMNKALMKDSLAKPSPNLKSSFINQSTLKFNSSVMGGSRIVSSSFLKPPKPTSNTKRAIPSSSCQPSRVPYDFRVAYSASKPVSGTFKAPNTMLKKPTINATSSAVPANKFAAAAKTAAAVNRIPAVRSIPVTGLPKPSKIQENPKYSIKIPNQVPSSLPKSTAGITKGIPVRPQTQMPVSNIRMKPSSIKAPNKPVVKDIPKPVTNVPSKNNHLFKKPISLKKLEPTANLKKGIQHKEISKKPETKLESKKTSKCSTRTMSQDSLENGGESKKSTIQTAYKKSPESDKNIKHSAKETLSDQSIESIPEFSFNCDVSVIKPSTSFAPTDFIFQPPIMSDPFDDDSWDYIHVVKKYLSRTSTPSKETSERTSGSHAKETKDSISKDHVVKENNKDILCQKSPDKAFENNPEFKTKDFISKDHAAKEENSKDILYQKSPDKASENNPEFKLSISGDFLGMETPDILVNNEIMDDMDGECNKNLKNLNEISSCRLSINKCTSKEMQNVSLERPEQLCINSCKNEINVINLLSESFVLENELGLTEPKTEVNSNDIALAAPLISTGINAIVPDKPLVSECIDEIAPAAQLSSEVTREIRSNKSMISDNVVPSRPQQKAGQIVAVSMLKEVMDDEIVSESEHNDLKDKLDESTECSILQDIDLSNVRKATETGMILVKLEEEENNDDFEKLEAVNLLDKKSTGSVPKRVSMLKSVSILNAIVETSELDESNIHSPGKSSKKHQASGASKNSIRLSTSHKSEISDEIKKFPVEKENDMSISITPRRSARLSRRVPNISGNETIDVFSPFKDQTLRLLNTPPRRSIRLINLNTPEENGEASFFKTGLSTDFAALKLSSENVDPNDLLLGFENSPIAARKPRKVSLLYSPDKRKSVRKSIKGDLICFSPSGN